LIVGSLAPPELRTRLRSSGLRVHLGPIAVAIRSPFRSVMQAIAMHYAAHPVVGDDDFVDFHVTVDSTGVRRLVKPQAVFRVETHQPFKPLGADQAFPLLEWGLNWCVSAFCHQFVIVHAAVVERDGRAVILPAPPGSGKSTLCAALVARGFRLFSDEVALIDVETGRLVPIPRPISLKNAAIATIAGFWPDAKIGPAVANTLKGTVAHVSAPRESVLAATRDAAPGLVVVPRYRAGEATTLEPLPKAAAFMQLVDNGFNYSVHGRAGFEVLSSLIDASRCFRFTYGGNLDEATAAIESLLRR
jgi:HprK-related kinase A